QRRGLGFGAVVEEPKRDDGALARWQPEQGALNAVPLSETFVARIRSSGGYASGLESAACGVAAESAAHLVDDGSPQISIGFLDLARTPPRVHGGECVSDDFLGQLEIAGDEVGEPEHGTALRREQRSEGVVALPRRGLPG